MQGSLDSNPFYAYVRQKHFARLLECDVMLIPNEVSFVASQVFQETDVEHHLLRKSGTRGEFLTLSGRPVTIVGRVVRTVDAGGGVAGDGGGVDEGLPLCSQLAAAASGAWPAPAAASIVDHVHDVPVTVRARAGAAAAGSGGGGAGGGQHSIAVYTVSRPLEGGLDAPATEEHMSAEQVEATVAMMRVFSDAEAVFGAVDAFVADVRGAAEVRNLLDLDPPRAPLILRQCEVAADMLLRSSVYAGGGVPGDRTHLVLLLECYTLSRMHGPLMAWLSMLFLAQCRTLRETAHALAGLQQADAGVKPALRCSYAPVLAVLSGLVDAKSPLAKLQVLKAASSAIEGCVTRHLQATGRAVDSVELGADDRLNILLFCLVRGAPRHGTAELLLHLQFVDMFGTVVSSRTSNELAQKAIEFRVATEYLLTRGREELGAEIAKRTGADTETGAHAGAAAGTAVVPPSPPTALQERGSEAASDTAEAVSASAGTGEEAAAEVALGLPRGAVLSLEPEEEEEEGVGVEEGAAGTP